MRRFALIAAASLALAAGAPASAGATTAQTADGSDASSYQSAIANSYMPTPDGSVTVQQHACPSNGASCALQRTIWLPAHDPATEPYTGTFMHELGHVLDYVVTIRACGCTDDTVGTPARAQFESIMGWDEPWATGSDRPNEAWADVYESCADKSTTASGDVLTTEYDYRLTAEQFNAACRLIASTAQQFGLDPAGRPSPGPIAYAPSWAAQPAPAAAPKAKRRHARRLRRHGMHIVGRLLS